MTDKELDGYLVLIRFMLKKKKSFPSKKSERFWVREIFKKKAVSGLLGSSISSKFFGRHFC